jgi:hypothetical protein
MPTRLPIPAAGRRSALRGMAMATTMATDDARADAHF